MRIIILSLIPQLEQWVRDSSRKPRTNSCIHIDTYIFFMYVRTAAKNFSRDDNNSMTPG